MSPSSRGVPDSSASLQMREQARQTAIVNQFVGHILRRTTSIEVAEDTEADPFLSALVRTQGRRRSTLIETLLSLAAQKSQDFQVVILAHDMKETALAELNLLVESFDTDFTRGSGIVRVEGGGQPGR